MFALVVVPAVCGAGPPGLGLFSDTDGASLLGRMSGIGGLVAGALDSLYFKSDLSGAKFVE